MTVSYRTSMTDNWQQLRYLFTKTIIGRCLLVFALVTPLAGPVAMYHTASLQHPAPSPKMAHLMALASWLMVGGTYFLFCFSGLVGLYLGTLINPKATITIDSDFCRLKAFMTVKSSWKQFLTVAEEPDYFYFVGWMRVFLVPKRAFNSSAEAYMFFDAASAHWCKAKGIAPPPAPNVSGIWPPAPRATDFQEPGNKT